MKIGDSDRNDYINRLVRSHSPLYHVNCHKNDGSIDNILSYLKMIYDTKMI